jgi:hypothetical protein
VIALKLEHPLNQGAPGIAHLRLGNNPDEQSRTLKRSGCLLLCLVDGYRVATKKPLGVEDALALLRARKCFLGNGLLWERAAGVLGLETVQDEFCMADVRAAIDRGWPVVVGLDYKDGRSSGVSDADHFVLVIGYDGDDVLILADPDGGRTLRMEARQAGGKPPRGVGSYLKPGNIAVLARLCEMRILRPG